MGRQLAELEAARDLLKVAGIDRVYIDLEDVQPPCVWLALDSFDVLSLGGGREATGYAYLVTQHETQTRALRDLDPLFDQIEAAGVIGGNEEPVTLVGLRTTKTQRELFAYRVPITFTY